MSKCDTCPVAAGTTCVVEAGADPWFCTMVHFDVWSTYIVANSPYPPSNPPDPKPRVALGVKQEPG